MEDIKLTVKQRAFADHYIELGNATQAYLKAYTNVKKETTAKANGSRLLTNANVNKYINQRLEELKKASIMEQDEILQFLTSIARGQVTEQTLIGVGEGVQDIANIDVSAKDRIKAAELLGKRYAMWTERQEIEQKNIVINLGGADYDDYED